MADGAQEAFDRLMVEARPRLHRYCARMLGSAFDGEDVVQEALARAAQAYGGQIERPEAWLFRIAHNAALDALRARRREAWILDDELADHADPRAEADVRVASAASLAVLARLPVAQRAVVVLVDVLGHSLAETAEVLDMTLAAVKAALHRARTRLQDLAAAADAPAPVLDPTERLRLRAYADRFNARDFDALRALLAEDVRLDLAGRLRLDGKARVEVYFGRYDEAAGWTVRVAFAEGRPVIVIEAPDGPGPYAVLLDWRDGRIARIRDYKYAPYVMEGVELADA